MTKDSAKSTGDAPERVLLIKAKGGLGNRILSAVTGLTYAHLTGRVPVIDWRDGVYAPPGVNAYPLLFDAPAQPDPADFDARHDVTPAVWAGRLGEVAGAMVDGRHSGPFVYRASCVDLARLDQPEPVAVFWSYLPKMGRLRRHIRGAALPRGSNGSIETAFLASHFTPNARVRSGIADALAGLDRPIIGAHLRYTDLRGPLDRVERALHSLRQATPNAPIFLATDSAEAQTHLTDALGNVRVIAKHFPEDGGQLHIASEGVDPVREAENALVDMWALAQCDRLVYSRASTFSLTSALIGGLKRESLVDVDARAPRIVLKRWVQNYT